MSTERDLAREARVIHILYLLHGLAPFTLWLLAVVAIIIGMAKRPDVAGTYLESHVSWLSRTFWWGLLWIGISAVVTFILVVTIVGILIWWLPWTVLFFWYLYRVIRALSRVDCLLAILPTPEPQQRLSVDPGSLPPLAASGMTPVPLPAAGMTVYRSADSFLTRRRSALFNRGSKRRKFQ